MGPPSLPNQAGCIPEHKHKFHHPNLAMEENLKFRPRGVDYKFSAKVIPLVYLSPLLTVMKELVWIVLYFLVNILKIDSWSFFSPSLSISFRDFEICQKDFKGDVDFSREILKTLRREYNKEFEAETWWLAGLSYTL